MNPEAYLDNIGDDLKAWSQDDSRSDIQKTLKFGGQAEELSTRDDIKTEVVCLRYKPGTFDVPVGSNKPSEWTARVEFLIYRETTGGKIDRDHGFNRMLELLGMCVDWSNQVDAAADIHSDFVDFYAISNGVITDDRPKYFAMPVTFEMTICI